MSNKIFPIKNDAACVFKWGWNTFRLHDATSSSCHRVQPVHIELDDFDNFHNTPAAIEDRQRMLDNQWPQAGRGCEYCKDIEDLGGVSDRTFHNNIPGLTPVDFDINTNQVTPRILEIFLSNTCDLACVYCMPIFSSRINDELKRYGSTPVGLQYISPLTNRAEYLNKFLAWLDNNYGKIKRLSQSGHKIQDMSGTVFYQACSDLYDSIVNARIVHGGQQSLVDGMNNCAAKESDAGWRIVRRKSAGDVSAAISLAMVVHQLLKPQARANPSLVSTLFLGISTLIASLPLKSTSISGFSSAH